MIVNENMIISVFLRENPDIRLETASGHLIWFDNSSSKYLYCMPNSDRFKHTYEAKGLKSSYNQYLTTKKQEFYCKINDITYEKENTL